MLQISKVIDLHISDMRLLTKMSAEAENWH